MGIQSTLHKQEKLSHKASIDAIFQKKGKSIFKPPILLAYYKAELISDFPCQLFVSVGKRKFKRAVDRNRIKRQITDIYRLQKQRIYNAVPEGDKYAIGILFLGREMPTHIDLQEKLSLTIDELIKRIK